MRITRSLFSNKGRGKHMHILLIIGIVLLALLFLSFIPRVFVGIIYVLLIIAIILIVLHFRAKIGTLFWGLIYV